MTAAHTQALIPGIIGFAPATDYTYLSEMQRAASAGSGLVNRLRLLFATIDTDTFFALDDAGRTPEAEQLIAVAAQSLRDGGADFLVVTSNTGSIIMEGVNDSLPMVDIFDSTIAEVARTGSRRPGLLSTRRTLESGRYQRAAETHDATVIAPPKDVVDEINAMIDDEAIRGIQTDASLKLLQDTVRWFSDQGADSVILGCTDLVLFGTERIGNDVLPVNDSTLAHARAAAESAISGR